MGNFCSHPSVLNSPRGGLHVNGHTLVPDPVDGRTTYGYAPLHNGSRPPPIKPPISALQQQPGTPSNTSSSGRERQQPAQGFEEVQPAPKQQPGHGEGVDEYGDTFEETPSTVPFAWQQGQLIGRGAFGQVYKGLIYATGQEVAVKQVNLPRDAAANGKVAQSIRALEKEVAVLKTVRHENIVRYLGTERTDEHMNIFLEFVPGGSLSTKLQHFGALREDTIKVYTKQILRGLEYLHTKKIMHRDIKGANILVDSTGIVKLADFGASKVIEDLATVGGSKSTVGTPNWMAPEIIKTQGHGRTADIWSLACVVIEMATGRPPWANFSDALSVMFHIANTRDLPAMPDTLSDAAKDFLALCFNRVPRERPNATRLLQHPWLQGVAVPRASGPSPALLPIPPPQPPRAQVQAQMASQTFGKAQQPPASHHPLSPGLRSPPSPITEESEYGSPNPATGAAAQPGFSAGPSRAGMMHNTVTSPAPGTRPNVPRLPLDAIRKDPHQSATAAPPKPPLPAPKVDYTSKQYDTLVDDGGMRGQLNSMHQQHMQSIARNLGAAAAAAAPAPPAADPALQASPMTLMFNPMEEPSWMPSDEQPYQAFFRQMAAVPEASGPESPAAAVASDNDNCFKENSNACQDAVRTSGHDTLKQVQAAEGMAATGTLTPRSAANTQRATQRSKAAAPARPALADVFGTGMQADTQVEADQPSPGRPLAAAAFSPARPQQPLLQSGAGTGRGRAGSSRRDLEDPALLGGNTADPARARQALAELAKELNAARQEKQQLLLNGTADSTARQAMGLVGGGRQSVADL